MPADFLFPNESACDTNKRFLSERMLTHRVSSMMTAEAKDFCSQLMQKSPKDRLSASHATKHPWIIRASTLHSGADAAHELAAHDEIVQSLEVGA